MLSNFWNPEMQYANDSAVNTFLARIFFYSYFTSKLIPGMNGVAV
jgi:hypothetical protein